MLEAPGAAAALAAAAAAAAAAVEVLRRLAEGALVTASASRLTAADPPDDTVNDGTAL
jgi:hypothetical protein